MNPLLRFSYEGVTQLARAAAVLAPRGEHKTLRTLRARRGIRARFAAWGRHGRDRSRPLLWMHAPSVGEGLQARPVLQQLRASHPELQLAYTFFSPSAESFARALDVDFADYLPFDSTGDARAALDAMQPRALVFSKLDVWPTLVREASRRGVRLGLISATLASGSGRRSGVAAAVLRDAYGRLDAIGAIDDEDAARLAALGARPASIAVTGDTRYDQVWARAQAVDLGAPLLAALRTPERPTLVAGSTWPADEAELLAAWLEVRRRVSGSRLIIAPHEPRASHLEPIEAWADTHALAHARLGTPSAADAEIILVDRVGVLGELYALADVAYVGGGFHAAGLHSVLEPAAFGTPVLFGPRFEGSRDARLLRARGGGESAPTAGELAARLGGWLASPMERAATGERARALVRSGLGAAARSAALVEQLVAER